MKQNKIMKPIIYKGYTISDNEMHYYPRKCEKIPKLVIVSSDEEAPLMYAKTLDEAKEMIDLTLEK